MSNRPSFARRWSASALIVLFLMTSAAFAQCTVRSGTSPVRYLANPGSLALTPADFLAAATGPAAVITTTNVAWITSLPCEPLPPAPSAKWISTSANSSGGTSALYSVDFPCMLPPNACNVILNVCIAVDNNLGNAVNEGIFLNGIPVPGTKILGGLAVNFTTQTSFSMDVTAQVVTGVNTLQILAENLGSQTGVIFRADLIYVASPIVGNFSLCDPLDSTFLVPQMTGAASTDPLQRNDDGSSIAPIPLGFAFNFCGNVYTEVYINNNGNLTFGAPLGTFTPFAFPSIGPPMIAPFFADVDTRNLQSGIVRYRSTGTRFTVTWSCVNYFTSSTNPAATSTNTFQVILSNGLDPLVGIGQNVCFCYGNMSWTTGNASGGTGGFGGTPATVGVNLGNGVGFKALGRFDAPGTAYDGALLMNDGVDWLDGKSFCFSVVCCPFSGLMGFSDFTINGAYSNSGSGLDVVLPLGSTAIFRVTSLPFSPVLMLYSLSPLNCPGLPIPGATGYDVAIDINNFADLSPGFTDATGDLTLILPAIPIPLCVAMQCVVVNPAFGPFAVECTQAYRVCIQ
jgi:hypothetical protein